VDKQEFYEIVEKLIVPYVGRLSELDSNSRFIETSTWGQMAASLSRCDELKYKLTVDEVYYLRLGGTENE
jgi:hypothetical protein